MAQDITALLTQDHREVDALLERLIDGQLAGEERAEAITTVIRELSMHAVAEEIVLYPEVRSLLPDGDRLADEALEEHQRIKEALDALDGMDPDDDSVTATISSVAAEVRHHVEEEEGELFVALRAGADPDRLSSLGQRLELAKKAAPTHPHPGAPNTPPGNVILGVPTAMVDRLRDALTG